MPGAKLPLAGELAILMSLRAFPAVILAAAGNGSASLAQDSDVADGAAKYRVACYR